VDVADAERGFLERFFSSQLDQPETGIPDGCSHDGSDKRAAAWNGSEQ
jgi:hypothetical protein